MEDSIIPMADVSATAITKTTVKEGPVTFSRIFRNSWQKPKTMTLEVRQSVVTVASYPTQRIDSDLQDTIFPVEDFGIESKVFSSRENRVGWILVPEATTEEEALAALAAFPNAVVYRILSNSPILDSNQEFAINGGLKTLNDFADTQVCRYPANDEKGRAGKLILDKAGNPFYRRTLYKRTPTADVDNRFGASPVYMSPKIAAELSGANVLAGQTV